jgi:hypothetical protein
VCRDFSCPLGENIPPAGVFRSLAAIVGKTAMRNQYRFNMNSFPWYVDSQKVQMLILNKLEVIVFQHFARHFL